MLFLQRESTKVEEIIENSYSLALIGKISEAQTILSEVKDSTQELSKNDIIEIEYIQALLLIKFKGEYSIAGTLFEKILNESYLINYSRGIANSNLGLGIVSFYRGIYNQAISYMNEGLVYDPQRGDILTELANVYQYKGEYDAAEMYYRKASKIYRDQNNVKKFLVPLYQLGTLLWRKEETENALEVLNQALMIAEELNVMSRDYLEALMKLSGIYSDLGKYKESKQTIEKASKLITEKSLNILKPMLSYAKGYLEESKANFGKAINYYSEVTSLTAKDVDTSTTLIARVRKANIYLILYRGFAEKTYFSLMVMEIERIENKAREENLYLILSELLVFKGLAFLYDFNYDLALKNLMEAKIITEKQSLSVLNSKIKNEIKKLEKIKADMQFTISNEDEESRLKEVQDYLKSCITLTRKHFSK